MSVNRQSVPVRECHPDVPLMGRPPAWRRHPDWLVGAGPALVALVVGGYQLGGPSLWRDEAYTVSATQRSTGQLLAMLLHVDAVHGPYYLFMHFVVRLLGISAVSLRLPSLIGMGVAAGVTAALGRRLALLAGWPAPAATGVLAGLLFAGSPQTTYYAQDARPYGPVIMFAVIATYLLVRAHADGGRRWWVGYSAAMFLTGLCNLFALMLIGTHAVSLLLARRSAHRAAAVGAAEPVGVAGPAEVADPLGVTGPAGVTGPTDVTGPAGVTGPTDVAGPGAVGGGGDGCGGPADPDDRLRLPAERDAGLGRAPGGAGDRAADRGLRRVATAGPGDGRARGGWRGGRVAVPAAG
jgi:hypothetical protein